ncbi:hypothetical protein [Pseudomonas synxantha]|uniref:hypothetical protein n=1 Tax=Pseudomonas synxantha TaxID=47883 RepID=UPI00117AF73A|nr:hypothetical protein [Pseudomonas synxantha]
MKITLFPSLESDECVASVEGDVVTLDGEVIDLSPLPDGFRLLAAELGNKFFVPTSYVERIDGELLITLFLRVEPATEEKWRSPPTPNVLVVESGVIPFPDTRAVEIEVPKLTPPERVEPPKSSIIKEESNGQLEQH